MERKEVKGKTQKEKRVERKWKGIGKGNKRKRITKEKDRRVIGRKEGRWRTLRRKKKH